MNKILHLVFSDISKDTGFSQRIRRQKEYIFSKLNVDLKTLNIVSNNEVEVLCEYENKLNKVGMKNVEVYQMGGVKILKPILALLKVLKKARKCDTVYTETHISSIFWLVASLVSSRKIKWVVDVHGVAPEERYDNSSKSVLNKIKYGLNKLFEKRYLKKAKHIIVVSQNLKEHYVSEYSIAPNKIIIVPNCIYATPNDVYITEAESNKTAQLKERLAPTGEVLYIYAGGVGVYHKVDSIVKWFDEKVKGNSKLILLIPKSYKSVDTIESNERVKIFQVDHSDVRAYLLASDFGIIFRDDKLLNIVADPTKVPEYLAAGIRIIHTESVRTVPRNDSNICVGPFKNLSQLSSNCISKKINQSKTTCENVEYVKLKYSWSEYLPLYKEVFDV